LKNFEASIRQNRKKARNYESPVSNDSTPKYETKYSSYSSDELNQEIDSFLAESDFSDSPFTPGDQIEADSMIEGMINEMIKTEEQTKLPMRIPNPFEQQIVFDFM
jgi:hypothetical protein